MSLHFNIYFCNSSQITKTVFLQYTIYKQMRFKVNINVYGTHHIRILYLLQYLFCKIWNDEQTDSSEF